MFKRLVLIGVLCFSLVALSATAAMAQGFNLGGWILSRTWSIDCEALVKGIGKQLPEDPSAILLCAVQPTSVTAYAMNPANQWGNREGIPFNPDSAVVDSESGSDLWIVIGKGKAEAATIISNLSLFRSVFGYPLPEGEYDESPYEDNANFQAFIAYLPNPQWSVVTPETPGVDPDDELIIVHETPAYVATYYCTEWSDNKCTGVWELKDYDSSSNCVLQEDDTYKCDKTAWDDIPVIPPYPHPGM
jgi:hypothetical protein